MAAIDGKCSGKYNETQKKLAPKHAKSFNKTLAVLSSYFSDSLKWNLVFLVSFLHTAIYEVDVVAGLTDDRTVCKLLMFGSLCGNF